MQEMSIITNQIFMLVLLGLTGYIAGKKGYLPEGTGKILSKVVIKLTAPILIFTTLANHNFTKEVLINGAVVYFLGIAVMLASLVIGHFSAKSLKLEGSTSNVFKMHFMFGNVIYLAFPLIKSMYGDNGLIYAVFYSLANDTMLWTIGIYLVNKHNKQGWKDNARHLINANTIAFSLGLLTIFIKLMLGDYIRPMASNDTLVGIFHTFKSLGETTIYFSMLFIGLILAETSIKNVKDLKKRIPIVVLSVFKLLIVPIVLLFVIALMGQNLTPIAAAVVILQAGMPCGTIVPALAAQYESDYNFATESVFFSTIIGIITMPFLVFLITKYL